MQKQIHVNSYTKRDGTQVKEHFRTIDTENYETAPVLHGGVSVDVGFPTGGGIGDVLGSIGGTLRTVVTAGLELAPIVLQMYKAMNSGNGQAVEYLKLQFNTKIKQLDTQVAQMKTNIDNNIAKLANVKNRTEYSKIYEPLQKDWQAYQITKNIVNRIKIHANNGDYQSVANDLGNFTSGNLVQNWDKNGKIYYTNPSGQPVNMKIPTSEYLKNRTRAFATNMNNWINETNPSSEAYKQKLYLTSLLASAPLSLGAGATSKLAQSLLPFLGQKIGKMTAQGLSNGIASGALSGFAKGLIYNQNPFITSAQDAGLFSVLGGASNYGLGNIEKVILQYQIFKSPLKEVLIDNYIKNYAKGLDNVTNELHNLRAAQSGVIRFLNKKSVLYDNWQPNNFNKEIYSLIENLEKYDKLNIDDIPHIQVSKQEFKKVINNFDTYLPLEYKLKGGIFEKEIFPYTYTVYYKDEIFIILERK